MAKVKDDLQSQVEYYAGLPYAIAIEKEDNGDGAYYVARCIELPDLLMTGDTPAEAVNELEAVKREWIEEYLELGNKMPVPLNLRKYSGKVILRMAPSLHKQLIKMSELEGVSLNQYMVTALSRVAGSNEVSK